MSAGVSSFTRAIFMRLLSTSLDNRKTNVIISHHTNINTGQLDSFLPTYLSHQLLVQQRTMLQYHKKLFCYSFVLFCMAGVWHALIIVQ